MYSPQKKLQPFNGLREKLHFYRDNYLLYIENQLDTNCSLITNYLYV